MTNLLLVIDMQNDFIDGALGTPEAVSIVGNVAAKVKAYNDNPDGVVYATRDTHQTNYLETQEGRNLPVEHCIEGTKGWELREEITALIPEDHIINKPTFGSTALAEFVKELYDNANGELTLELVGLCTDICVVSNALLLKANFPEVPMTVDPACCAGVTPEKHNAALETMASCQVEIL